MPISYKLTIQPVSWGCDYGNNGILLQKTLRRHGGNDVTHVSHCYKQAHVQTCGVANMYTFNSFESA